MQGLALYFLQFDKPLKWLVLCFNLSRLWCPFVCLNTNQDVAYEDIFQVSSSPPPNLCLCLYTYIIPYHIYICLSSVYPSIHPIGLVSLENLDEYSHLARFRIGKFSSIKFFIQVKAPRIFLVLFLGLLDQLNYFKHLCV